MLHLSSLLSLSLTPSGESTTYILDVVMKARAHTLGPFHPSFNVVQFLRDGLYIFLPPNAHKIASGRLFVSLTRLSDRKNVLVSQFDTFEDLVQVSVLRFIRS